MKTFAALIVAAAVAGASATSLYEIDFSQSVSIDHTTNGNPLEASPQLGANFEIGYSGAPASDTTRNFFETQGNALISSDFGGDHYFLTNVIDVSGWNEVSIDILNQVVGDDPFNNAASEFIRYTFSLDGGAAQTFFLYNSGAGNPPLNASTLVDVTGISSMTVRIDANVNGAGDGWELTQANVTGTIVPEPASALLIALGALAIRRR